MHKPSPAGAGLGSGMCSNGDLKQSPSLSTAPASRTITHKSFHNALTPHRVRELFEYNPETGEFIRRVARGGERRGARVKTLTDKGYLRIGIDGADYRAHRVAWLYVHGEWPADQLDHINGKRSDNRIANLRLASHAENSRNRYRSRNNTSGYKGVDFNRGRWRALIGTGGKNLHLGYFSSAAEAHAAYCRAAQELFGEFWNAGHTAADALEAVRGRP